MLQEQGLVKCDTMRDIYIKDPDGDLEYDGEEDNTEYEEIMEELRLISDSYNW